LYFTNYYNVVSAPQENNILSIFDLIKCEIFYPPFCSVHMRDTHYVIFCHPNKTIDHCF